MNIEKGTILKKGIIDLKNRWNHSLNITIESNTVKKKKKESSIVYEKPVREGISQDRSGS